MVHNWGKELLQLRRIMQESRLSEEIKWKIPECT
jgi:hypothetical protein